MMSPSMEQGTPPAHPHLKEPLLHVSDIDAQLDDADIAGSFFASVLPVKLHLDRSGSVWSPLSGSVQFKTLDSAEKALATLTHPTLSIDPHQSQFKTAKPLLIKQLPPSTTNASLYDLFRPYGAIARAHCITEGPQGEPIGFRGMATVTYYQEQHSEAAQNALHCIDVEGKSITVRPDNRPTITKPASPVSPNLSSSSARAAAMKPRLSAQSPARLPSDTHKSAWATVEAHDTTAPLQQELESEAPTAANTAVDPRNLFIKNLEPSLSHSDLFEAFRKFGHIVSARVKLDDEGNSLGFGFVMFSEEPSATRAKAALDRTVLGSKKIAVSVHEPRDLRRAKMAHRYAEFEQRSESRKVSGASHDSGISSPQTSPAVSPRLSKTPARLHHGDANPGTDEGNGVANPIQASDSTPRVDEEKPSNASLSSQNGVTEARTRDAVQPEDSSVGSAVADSSVGNADKERTRLFEAVRGILPSDPAVVDIVDMMAGLPKKERAMALFSTDYLRSKVAQAKELLEMTREDSDGTHASNSENAVQSQSRGKAGAQQTSQISASNSSAKDGQYTLASLAGLPCKEVIALVRSTDHSLPLPPIDEAQWSRTDSMMDAILSEPREAERKQKLGDVLFKKVKAVEGIKGAPKITIRLLDSEDLRALAHTMDSFPALLEQKVMRLAAPVTKS